MIGEGSSRAILILVQHRHDGKRENAARWEEEERLEVVPAPHHCGSFSLLLRPSAHGMGQSTNEIGLCTLARNAREIK